MGIPRFARWLTQRYPFIVCSAAQYPKPQFDHFYIDLNGIIHHSAYRVEETSSGTRKFVSRGEKETAATVFAYIDLIVSIVGPTRTIYVAIDGPAPRAKINQQRQRRFRVDRDRKARMESGAADSEQEFDPNCITPGTEFMARIAEHLQFFLRKKVEEDRLWRRLHVVFSGPDVPGEGEHKIAQFIRKSVREGAIHPNESHCIYGLDADLIMLGLVTHLQYVAILREKVVFKKKNQFDSIASAAADAGDDTSAPAEAESETARTEIELQSTDEFQFVHLCLLREAFEMEFCGASPVVSTHASDTATSSHSPHSHREETPPQRELNKVIDDLIFLCYLIGNDFVPEVPLLGLDNDGLNTIFEAYKEFVSEGNLLRHKLHVVDVDTSRPQDVRVNYQVLERVLDKIETRLQAAFDNAADSDSGVDTPPNTAPAAIESTLKQLLGIAAKAPSSSEPAAEPAALTATRTLRPYDAFRQQYYTRRFPELGFSEAAPFEPHSVDHAQRLHQTARGYFEGILWTFYYYYRDTVPSWSWAYPHHFAPMLRDISAALKLWVGTRSADLFDPQYFSANAGAPYRPFEQLLAVLPPASAQRLLPPALAALAAHPSLKPCFPEQYAVWEDERGREWRNIALIPAVNMPTVQRLVEETIAANMLSPADIARNTFGVPKVVYFSESAEPAVVRCPLPELSVDLVDTRTVVKDLSPSDSAAALSLSAVSTPSPPYGFPTSRTLRCWAKLERGRFRLVVYQSESAAELWHTARTGTAHIDQCLAALAELLIGKEVYVEYPYGVEARVVAVSTPDFLFRRSRRGKVVADDRSGTRVHADQWRKAMAALSQSLRERGVDVSVGPHGNHTSGVGDVVVHAAPLRFYAWHKAPSSSFRQQPLGIVGKHFDEAAAEAAVVPAANSEKRSRKAAADDAAWPGYAYPLVTVTQRHPQRSLPLPTKPPHCAVGTRVVYLAGSAASYGSVAMVTGVVLNAHSPPAYTLTLANAATLVKEPFFGRQVVAATSGSDRYVPAAVLCRDLNLSGLALTRLAGSLALHIAPKASANANDSGRPAEGLLDSAASEGSTVDIGLGMKFSGRHLQVPGYARKKPRYEGGGWEYSERAVALIKEYARRFPEVFAAVEAEPRSDVYEAHEVFSADQSGVRLRELLAWLDSGDVRAIRRLPLVSCDIESLMDSAVKRIEAEAKAFAEQLAKRRTTAPAKAVTLRDVPHHAVADPTTLVLLLPMPIALSVDVSPPVLGDRVVYLWDTGAVPLGARGTVVTIDRTGKRAEVVFDDEWLEGSTLHGRLSTLRGASVPLDALQRITPEVIAAVAAAAASQASPTTTGRGRGTAKPLPKKRATASQNAFDMLGEEED